jgi:hypothetical protein
MYVNRPTLYSAIHGSWDRYPVSVAKDEDGVWLSVFCSKLNLVLVECAINFHSEALSYCNKADQQHKWAIFMDMNMNCIWLRHVLIRHWIGAGSWMKTLYYIYFSWFHWWIWPTDGVVSCAVHIACVVVICVASRCVVYISTCPFTECKPLLFTKLFCCILLCITWRLRKVMKCIKFSSSLFAVRLCLCLLVYLLWMTSLHCSASLWPDSISLWLHWLLITLWSWNSSKQLLRI